MYAATIRAFMKFGTYYYFKMFYLPPISNLKKNLHFIIYLLSYFKCNFKRNLLYFQIYRNFLPYSRSVLGPSKDHPPDPSAAPLQPPIEPPLPDCLKFESRFESGNLAKVIRITEAYYEIYLRPDYYTSKHCQWFYFQVSFF